MTKIQSILKYAMRMEKDSQVFYEYYTDVAEAESTRKLFRELAEIEKEHYRILNEKYGELTAKDPPIVMSWVVDDTSREHAPGILADNSDTLGSYGQASLDLNITRMAFLIENDFMNFYDKASEIVDDPEVKKLLRTFSKWEAGHRDMFQERYKKLLNEYWKDLSFIFE